MILKPSLILTSVLGASTLAVLGVLTDFSKPPQPAVPPAGVPIPELDAAEAVYAEAQRVLDEDLRRLNLTTLLVSPEERRDRLMAWPDQNRAALDAQNARSQAIQKLYDRHHIPGPPGLVEVMAARAPKTPAEAASPAGRLWALENEAARLRETHAGDPEKLRDALMAWEAEHGAAARELSAEISAGIRKNVPPASKDPVAKITAAASLPADATPADRQLAALRDRLDAIHEANPGPGQRTEGPPATAEELEAWRDRIMALTAPIEEEMRPFNQAAAARDHQKLIEHIHEQTR
ncbi:MAG: hypothetical protein V4726_21070 [Verrucomicrobiota bacterium]